MQILWGSVVNFFPLIISSLLLMVWYLKIRVVYRTSSVTSAGRGHACQSPRPYQQNTPLSNIVRWCMWIHKTANADQFDLETLNSLREEHRGNDDVCNSNYRKGLQIVILEHYHYFSCVYLCSDHDFPLLGSGSEFPASIQLPTVTYTACLWYLGYKGSRAEDINNRVLLVNVILMHCGWATSVLNMENVYTLSPPIQMFTCHPS